LYHRLAARHGGFDPVAGRVGAWGEIALMNECVVAGEGGRRTKGVGEQVQRPHPVCGDVLDRMRLTIMALLQGESVLIICDEPVSFRSKMRSLLVCVSVICIVETLKLICLHAVGLLKLISYNNM
jgi:hypothetical protein